MGEHTRVSCRGQAVAACALHGGNGAAESSGTCRRTGAGGETTTLPANKKRSNFFLVSVVCNVYWLLVVS